MTENLKPQSMRPAETRMRVNALRGRLYDRFSSRTAAMVAVLALATVLYTHALSQNGYANTFYSAGVRSMLDSWHNFFFVSFDPGGLISIDKPPLGLWLQAASAEIFGFSPLSLLLPEALAGVLAVAALYLIVKRRFGYMAGLISALVLAVFPSFAAVARDNNLDALLILLMVLACGTGLRAIETGRWVPLLGCAVIFALAFNTKALAAYIALPGVALAYLACAQGSLPGRLVRMLVAGVVLAVLSLAWMLTVDSIPSGQRPFVGGSTDNSEIGLTFSYNGFGRVGGQLGGPGPAPDLFFAPSGSSTVAKRERSSPLAKAQIASPAPDVAPAVHHNIDDDPISFGRSPGPLRLFQKGMGSQGAWLMPFALIGLLVLALGPRSRRDPKLAALIVLGGFFLLETAVLSFSGGIVHPYYVSALGPGLAAMVGAGMSAILTSPSRLKALLAGVAICLSVAAQVIMLNHDHYLAVWMYALIAICLVGVGLLAKGGSWFTPVALGALAALLVAPAAYSFSTWRRPVESTFPAAGPRAVGGYGGAGLSPEALAANDRLINYILVHGPGTRFQLLTQASVTAAPLILLGLKAAALGGYGGVDPALDGPRLGRLVATGDARYVLIGGGYGYLGGNKASRAAEKACRQVPPRLWSSQSWAATQGLYLLDCRGVSSELAN